jgi:phage terminase large subunit
MSTQPAAPSATQTAAPASNDLRRYAGDPLAFAREVLGVEPWEAQQNILLSVRDFPRTTVRSSHGVGKTWTAACAALWWIYSHRPSLVISTAPTARQVESLLWAEIHRLWTRSGQGQRQPLPGRCLQTRLEAALDQTGVGLATTEPERFAGWHCEHLLVIVDEASGVADSLFEVIQGSLTAAHCRLLLIGNPTRADGYFHRSHHQGDWRRLKISAYDTPNFRCSGVQAFGRSGPDPSDPTDPADPERLNARTPEHLPLPFPHLVTPEWVEARRAEWGEDSDPFRVRVLGEFPHASSDALIRLEWIEAAERKGVAGRGSGGGSDDSDGSDPTPHTLPPTPHDEVVLGVDVARYGDCQTVVALRRGAVLTGLWAWQGADLMHTCGRVVDLARQHQPDRLVIDAVGLGAGVVDRLREVQREGHCLSECHVEEFQAGGTAQDPEQHASRRDEAYLALSHRLRTGAVAFADHWSLLTDQLGSLNYGFTSRGQITVESKDDRRRRGEASPDWADAVARAFAPRPAAGFPAALGSRRVVAPALPPLRSRA